MSTAHNKPSPLETAAAFIVDKRRMFYVIYLLLIVFSAISATRVSVNNTLTD